MNVVHDEDEEGGNNPKDDAAGTTAGDGAAANKRSRASGKLLTHGSENSLAAALKAKGMLAQVEPQCRLLEQTTRPSNNDSDTADPLDHIQAVLNLAAVLQAQNKNPEETKELLRRGLASRQRLLGEAHPLTLQALKNLAVMVQEQGGLPEAEDLWKQVLTGNNGMLGSGHPQTLDALHNLASCLQAQDKLAEAEPLYRETVKRCQLMYGPNHPSTVVCVSNLALLLLARGKLQEAEPLFRQALCRCEASLGPEHPNALNVRYNLACHLIVKRQQEQKEREDSIDKGDAGDGGDKDSSGNKGDNKEDEADRLLREGMQLSILSLGMDHPITKRFQQKRGDRLGPHGRRSPVVYEAMLLEVPAHWRGASPPRRDMFDTSSEEEDINEHDVSPPSSGNSLPQLAPIPGGSGAVAVGRHHVPVPVHQQNHTKQCDCDDEMYTWEEAQERGVLANDIPGKKPNSINAVVSAGNLHGDFGWLESPLSHGTRQLEELVEVYLHLLKGDFESWLQNTQLDSLDKVALRKAREQHSKQTNKYHVTKDGTRAAAQKEIQRLGRDDAQGVMTFANLYAREAGMQGFQVWMPPKSPAASGGKKKWYPMKKRKTKHGDKLWNELRYFDISADWGILGIKLEPMFRRLRQHSKKTNNKSESRAVGTAGLQNLPLRQTHETSTAAVKKHPDDTNHTDEQEARMDVHQTAGYSCFSVVSQERANYGPVCLSSEQQATAGEKEAPPEDQPKST